MLILRHPDGALKRVELAPGAHAMVRSATSLDVEIGMAAYQRGLQAAGDLEEFAAHYGLPLEKTARKSLVTMSGLNQLVMWAEIGMRCIDSWEGVIDEGGQPAEVTARNISLLMLSRGPRSRLMEAMSAEIHEIVAEGNASAASANGAQVAETNIAPTAPGTEPPAPAV